MLSLTEEYLAVSHDLLAFIDESPSMFHTANAIRNRLEEAGFVYLSEGATWSFGGKQVHRTYHDNRDTESQRAK